MAVVFALVAAAGYGLADFLGARAARTTAASRVTFVAQLISLVVVLPVAIVLGESLGSGRDVLLSLAAGVAAGVALSLFYWGMARGVIAVVAPITAITGIVVPVVWGVAFGESPGVVGLVGLVLAPIAIGVVCGAGGSASFAGMSRIIVAALLGGALFGSIYILLSEISTDTGLWPLVYLRLASISVAYVLSRPQMKSGRRSFESLRLCAWCGIADAAANVGLLIASRNGYVSVVAVVASMYPAVTLVLASRVDHERIGPVRLGGLMLSAVVVSLVAIG